MYVAIVAGCKVLERSKFQCHEYTWPSHDNMCVRDHRAKYFKILTLSLT